jgi:hypothetical protein
MEISTRAVTSGVRGIRLIDIFADLCKLELADLNYSAESRLVAYKIEWNLAGNT